MKTQIFKLAFLFLLISCGIFHEDKTASSNSTKVTDNGNYRQFVEAMDNITNKLNLPNLKNGVDSFELRIWCPISADMQNIINIRYIYSHWNISETYVWETYPAREFNRNNTVNHLTEVIIDSTKSKTITCIADREKLIDTLLNKFISNFPKRSDLEASFEIGTDSYRYIVEIAEKDKYQMLDYDCGGNIVDKQGLHNKIKDFLHFIKRNIDDKIPACN